MNRKFSIVCYLAGEKLDRVRNLQEEVSKLTGSRASLDSWIPHVTVGDGIWVSEPELKILEKELFELTNQQEKFLVNIGGFGGLTNRKGGEGEVTTPYVLWIDVDVNENLKKLVDNIYSQVSSKYKLWYSMPKPYTPHVTVAFRDLSKEGYYKGLQFLEDKKFSDEIEVSHIALVEKLPDKDVEYKRFYFK